jgi:hypothetical protein
MSKVIDPALENLPTVVAKARNDADQQRGQIAQLRGHWA